MSCWQRFGLFRYKALWSLTSNSPADTVLFGIKTWLLRIPRLLRSLILANTEHILPFNTLKAWQNQIFLVEVIVERNKRISLYGSLLLLPEYDILFVTSYDSFFFFLLFEKSSKKYTGCSGLITSEPQRNKNLIAPISQIAFYTG